MRSLLLSAALLLATLAAAPAAATDLPGVDAPTPYCVPVLQDDGTTGVSCGLAGANCAQVIWGYHSEFLTVGGNNGCHAAVLVNPNAEPDDGFVIEHLMESIDLGGLPVQCTQVTLTAVECWLRTGLSQDVGVRCAKTTSGVGVFCTLLGFNCFQVLWGYHSPDLVVGGYHTCNAGAWADPSGYVA